MERSANANRSAGGRPVEWRGPDPQTGSSLATLDQALENPTLTGRVGTQAGGTVYVQAQGFAPGSGVQTRLDSQPRTLTTATADHQGRILKGH